MKEELIKQLRRDEGEPNEVSDNFTYIFCENFI